MVVEAQTKNAGARQFDTFLRRADFIIEPVTEEQAYTAALAKVTKETLLYKGTDFRKTDVSAI